MHVILGADLRPKQNHKDENLLVVPQEQYLFVERFWTDVESQKYSLSDYEVSKKLVNLLRHGSLPRVNDGAIEFWRMKDYLQDDFVFCHHWSDEKWKSSMTGAGGHKKRFQYCADSSRTILYLRPLQGHSRRNLIDPSLQDNVVIPDGFFEYICHVGCTVNLHSVINGDWYLEVKFWAKDGQSSFCLCILWTKPDTIDLGAPRLAQYMHKVWKNIKTRCIGSTSILLKRKDWSSIERHHSSWNTTSLLCYESCSDGNWRSHIRKSVCVISISSKDFLETWLEEGTGFRRCSTTRRWSCSTSKRFPPNQTQIQITIERGDPLFAHSQSVHPQRLTRWTSTSEYLECHILLWNKPKILVFVSSW